MRGRPARFVPALLTALIASGAHGCADERCAGGVEVGFETAGGSLSFCADVAATAAERKAGLSSYASLPVGRGLLMVFPVTGEVCITNEPVAFPIDVAFIGADSRVVAIAREIPAGDPGVTCHDEVARVFEANAGALAEVEPGSDVSAP